ncbi:MAG: TlpA family protein disulfide reductase [Elusimicrobiales bacterium]|jgi:peroxiredoxin|nr:TlpA family protein disulfide reductase [Elusimicrobiales bacterium]NLH39073.1 TlpA family protein disulfide reductase [Elusimicrobiota bacterium]
MKKIFAILILGTLIVSCNKNDSDKSAYKTNIAQNETASDYKKTDFYFSLPGKDGKDIRLDDYKNKPVMVIFFAENCPYCLKAGPYIQSIYKKYNPEGLSVIGISIRDSRESAVEFQKRTGVMFPLAYSGKEIAKNYGISGVPFIYVLDKNHNMIKMWAGYDEQYDSDIDNTIKKVIKI